MMPMYCFLFRGVVVGEVVLMMLPWWCLYCCYKKFNTVAELLFCVIFLLLLAVCTRIAVRALALLQRLGIWYLLDINICFLSGKNASNYVSNSIQLAAVEGPSYVDIELKTKKTFSIDSQKIQLSKKN
jgi:hypothetical protein